MRRTTVGDFELTVVSDGLYYLDGGAMFGVVPKPMWEKKMPTDAQNRVRLGMNSLVIRTGKHTILVETGAGNKLPEKLCKIYDNQALLLENLAKAGIAPDDIDVVINTHLHFDHCGWNTVLRADGTVVPTFPKARYYFQRGELMHAHEQHERDGISYISANYDTLVTSGRATLLDGDAEIVPGVSVRRAPGHTAHHQIVVIESEGQKAAYLGDLIPTTAHLHPTWVMGYELAPIACIDNRKRYYAEAIPEHWLSIFTHDPVTPWAYVRRDEAGKLEAKALPEEDQISITSTTEVR